MSRTGLRLACLAHTRCPAPCTRAHACTARSTRTLHACEPRQRHALPQQHALTRQKHSVVPRVTGNWLTFGRPAAEPSSAQLQHKCTRHLSLLTSHVHHPHAVHATHHHCCGRPSLCDHSTSSVSTEISKESAMDLGTERSASSGISRKTPGTNG